MTSILPANNVNIPNPYQLGGLAGADSGAYRGIQSLGQYNLGGQNMPAYESLVQQSVNNPYAGQYQQGAGVAGQYGQQAGVGAYNAGGSLMGSSLDLLPDVSALVNLGFDPQNALYARTQQQVQDQNNARNAQSGVGATPYGAGLSNQANQNFNIDWQNNQLQRAATGAGAAGSLLGQAGQGLGTGAGLQAGGVQEYLQGAAQPYNTFNQINAQALGTLGQAEQYGNAAAQIPQQQIQDYLGYLSQGNQNAQTNINAQQLNLQKQNALFNQGNAIGQDIGGLAGFGFGGGGGGQYGGMGNPFASFFGGGGGGSMANQWQQNPYAYGGANLTGLPGV